MKKNSSSLSGRIYIIDDSQTKLWYALDEEHHAEIFLGEGETERIKKKILNQIKNTFIEGREKR